jgi:hypothetical protein
MQFLVARPDVVRAVSQRWLLKFWKRHADADRVPRWQAVEAEDLSRLADNLSFLDVVGGDGTTRFQIRYHGATIGKVYDSTDCRGKYLDDVIPETQREKALKPYHQAVESGAPVYTIHDVVDRSGRAVAYERLLLPFASDGRIVDRILAAFEFICADGAFDRHALMAAQSAPTLRLCATIEAKATA